jgi:2-keto-4-pentenoate hydratase
MHATQEDAEVIAALRRARSTGRVEDWLLGRGLSVDDGIRLQLAVLDEDAARARRHGQPTPLAGWKVAFTSAHARQGHPDAGRPFAYLRRSHVLTSPARIRRADAPGLLVEPELAVVLASPLVGPVDPATAAGAIGALAPAFELNQLRCPAGASIGLLVADGLANWGVVLGSAVPLNPGDRLDDLVVETSVDARASEPAPVLERIDHPWESLAALANSLAERGRRLEAGQIVLTGSVSTVQLPDHPAFEVRADFGRIGTITMRCDDDRP